MRRDANTPYYYIRQHAKSHEAPPTSPLPPRLPSAPPPTNKHQYIPRFTMRRDKHTPLRRHMLRHADDSSLIIHADAPTVHADVSLLPHATPRYYLFDAPRQDMRQHYYSSRRDCYVYSARSLPFIPRSYYRCAAPLFMSNMSVPRHTMQPTYAERRHYENIMNTPLMSTKHYRYVCRKTPLTTRNTPIRHHCFAPPAV